MKIAFFGTPDFVTDFLDTLVVSGYVPSLVVTNPDRASGRGMTTQSPAPKAWADAHMVTCLQPERIDDEFLAGLEKEEWDLFVVVAYGKILPERLIHMPHYGTLNIHYSLLPRYRGATPVESAILNGDSVTGVCIQQMAFALDTGDILDQREVTIDPTDTSPSLRDKLNTLARDILPEVITAIESHTITPVKQSADGISRCTKIAKEDGLLDLTDDGVVNDRKYRAYYGSIGTYFYTQKNGAPLRVKILTAHLDGETFVIDEVIPENGKKMPYDIFVSSL